MVNGEWSMEFAFCSNGVVTSLPVSGCQDLIADG
jgi:hypothetical protein